MAYWLGAVPWRRPAEPDEDAKDDPIDHYQYLLLMAGCLVVTLPLELALGARVYRRPGLLLLALLPVVVVFSAWDIVGILRGHWTYSARFVSGLQLGFGMPVEELVFFVVVPICGLLTYETVGVVLRRLARTPTGSPADTPAPPAGPPRA